MGSDGPGPQVGLPADAQITTARDQALLGRVIQEHFPEYYRYFALPSFQFRGMSIGNHNALLRQMEGVDGIKTGYTAEAGYCLVFSATHNGHNLIGVILFDTNTNTVQRFRDAKTLLNWGFGLPVRPPTS